LTFQSWVKLLLAVFIWPELGELVTTAPWDFAFYLFTKFDLMAVIQTETFSAQ